MIEEKIALIGRDRFLTTARQLMLQTIDMFWVEHLEVMDYTRSSVNLRASGQRDPLVEYKKEGLRLFKEMEESIQNSILGSMTKINENTIEVTLKKDVERQALKITGTTDGSVSPAVATNKKNIGRNDPCWCGSGKKFKKCHGY